MDKLHARANKITKQRMRTGRTTLKFRMKLRGDKPGMARQLNDFNQAIMIRSFMSRNNTLFYQAGAGIVSESVEEKELQEVNNKLMALKNAMIMAKDI